MINTVLEDMNSKDIKYYSGSGELLTDRSNFFASLHTL